MKRQQHYHKYRKTKLGKDGTYIVYACQEPSCKHYITPQLLIGKIAKCHHCDNLFTVGREQIRKGQLKLHCKLCTKGEKRVTPAQVSSFLANFGIEPGE